MALLRSYLFAPGNNDKLLEKVYAAGADAVVLDLEDAVPAGEKGNAREKVRAALRAREGRPGPLSFVRINAIDSELWPEDLIAVVGPAITGIRVPKVQSAEDVRRVDAAIAELESERGLPLESIELQCVLETARGIASASAIAAASPRVKNLNFGASDFAHDTGVEPGPLDLETLYARSQIVIASRVAGIDPPVASVYTRLQDEQGLVQSSEAARRLGFFGRSCIHPKQVPVVNHAFTLRPEDVAQATQVVEAYERAVAAGSGAITLGDGQFVDLAVVRRAQKTLEIAGLVPREARKA